MNCIGAGGFLQSLVFGASGMRISKEALFFSPPAPHACDANVTQFRLHSFHYRGCRLRQDVTADTVSFELLDVCSNSLAIVEEQSGITHPLDVGAPVTVRRGALRLEQV